MKLLFTFLVFVGVVSSAGAQWKQCKGPEGGKISCFATLGSSIFAGTTSNGVFRSDNNGENWLEVSTGLKNSTVLSLISSGNSLFAGTMNGFFTSKNMGETWINIDSLIGYSRVNSLTVCGASIIAGTSINGLFKSTGIGLPWKYLDLESYIVLSLTSVDSIILAGMRDGSLFLSLDSGKNWEQIDMGLPIFQDILSLAINGTSIFVAMGIDGIHRSNDYGKHWTDLGLGVLNHWVLSFAVLDSSLFVGTGGGVYLTKNNAESWIDITTGLKSSITALCTNGNTMYAGTYDIGIWKFDLRTLSVEETPAPSTPHLSIYPNPTTTSITVDRASLPFTMGAVNYIILSVTGEKLLDVEQSETRFSLSVDGLPSGVYSLIARQGVVRSAVVFTVVR